MLTPIVRQGSRASVRETKAVSAMMQMSASGAELTYLGGNDHGHAQ